MQIRYLNCLVKTVEILNYLNKNVLTSKVSKLSNQSIKEVLKQGEETMKTISKIDQRNKSLVMEEGDQIGEDKDGNPYIVKRKGTTSYAFMKSQVIDNALRARKKNKNKIILKNKRKLSEVDKSYHEYKHDGNRTMKSKESNSLILLKQK